MSPEKIAIAFSNGQFELAFPYLADEVEWHIIGESLVQGKTAVMDYCRQTAEYFKEVTTEFKQNNLVAGDNLFAIDGTAIFTKKDGGRNFISSCDLYRFEAGKLVLINSYCISTKKETK